MTTSPHIHPHIHANNLSISRQGNHVIHNLSFSLPPQTSCLVKGQNGSGKTSLLLAIAAFLPLSQGSLSFHTPSLSLHRRALPFHTENINTSLIHAFHSLISFLPAETPFQPHLTPLEDLSLWHALASHEHSLFPHTPPPLAHNPLDALSKLHINTLAHTPVSSLSSGQKRRLSLARLLLKPANLWLLDEPSHHLDPQGAQLIHNLCSQFLASGGTLVYADPFPLFSLPHHHTLTLDT